MGKLRSMIDERELPLLAAKLAPYIKQALKSAAAAAAGGGGGAMVAHDIAGGYHTGTLSDAQGPQFALVDGSRPFTGNLTFTGSQTVDGVDVSAHAANASAHHAPVTAGALIGLSGQQVSLANGSAQYQIPVTGASPFTPAYTALSSFAGGGIGFSSGQFVVGVANTGATGLTQETDLIRLTSSSAPTGASILASDSGGGLTLQDITVASDADTELILGRAKLFSSVSDNMMLAHFDHANSTDYALRQTSAAQTLLNAASGQSINFRINNADIAVLSSGGINLSAGSFSITGAGDLTVGSNIFFVDNSGSNIGVNCAPDPQFDLDVAGNFRAQGFIVGKHAVQISDAVAIYHWDGVSTNTSGETRSHLGQAPTTVANSPEFIGGKFGKAISFSNAQTQMITNNSFETDTSGWITSTATIIRTGITQFHGGYCALLTPTSLNGFSYVIANTNSAIGTSYTFAVWARAVNGTATLRLYIQQNNGSTNYVVQDFTINTTWQLYQVTGTATVADAPRCIVRVMNALTPIYFDAVILSDGTIARPFSSATRSNSAYLTYASQGIGASEGTIMMWARPFHVSAFQIAFYLFDTANTDRIELILNSTGKWRAVIGSDGDISTTASATLYSWQHVAMTWNNGTVKIYLNGVLEATGSYTVFGTVPPTYQISNSTSPLRGDLDDIVIRSIASSDAEIRAIYESNAPVFAETSTFNFRAGGGLVWADAEGLWMYDSSGTAILGVSGVDSKSWGGRTLNTGDFSLGQYGSSNGGWFLFDQIDTSSKPSLTMGYGTAEAFRFDASGNKISGALTVTGSLVAGGATIDSSGVAIGVDNTFAWSTAAGFQNVTVATGRAYRFTGATQNNFLGVTGNYASDTSTLALINENQSATGTSKESRIIVDSRSIMDSGAGAVSNASVWLAASQWNPGAGVVNVAKILMDVASASNINIKLDSRTIEAVGGFQYANLTNLSSTPSMFYNDDAATLYMKGKKLICRYNDSGTTRYKYLDMSGTGVTWVHTTSAP